ncbi:flavin reductase [Rhizobium paknamense]|uniref:Flavin reductase n=1 Tax=Rhizobium paknamense TaxID=1206817 RepID=A0ABU0IGR8_9HYPH|nr:flavin reductase [Rhizobium paknamense]MDQ0456441.1 flavin reductase [Rhizobium paknamense]
MLARSDDMITEAEQARAAYREAMANLAAAVTIVTTDGEAGRAGFAATAVCSVSDTPPTLLVCLNKGSSAYAAVKANGIIAVNVLGQQHQPVSQVFGGKTPMQERFATGTWESGDTGCPILSDALASFDCRIERMVDGGTHDILIAQVLAIHTHENAPLIYFQRGYHTL